MISFKQFLIEKSVLKKNMVFRSLDKEGDLANELLLVRDIKDDLITVRFENGREAISNELILNIDYSSIRPYDKDFDNFNL